MRRLAVFMLAARSLMLRWSWPASARTDGRGVNAGGVNVGSGLRVAPTCSIPIVPSIRARVGAQHAEQLEQLGSLAGRQLVERALAGADQGADGADLRVGRDRLRARPLSELRDGDPEPLAGLEQPFEVGVEVGQVRGVGAEVLAAEALVAERAVRAERSDVVLLGAVPERDRDPADLLAQPLGLDQRGLEPDPPAVVVHRERREPLDRFALARPRHPVVDLRGRRGAVVHQLLQRVERHPGVRVALCVAVTQRVQVDVLDRERAAVLVEQRRDRSDPLARPGS